MVVWLVDGHHYCPHVASVTMAPRWLLLLSVLVCLVGFGLRHSPNQRKLGLKSRAQTIFRHLSRRNRTESATTPSLCRVAVGYCADLDIAVSAVNFSHALHAQYPDDVLVGPVRELASSARLDRIESLQQFYEQFVFFFGQGANAEKFVVSHDFVCGLDSKSNTIGELSGMAIIVPQRRPLVVLDAGLLAHVPSQTPLMSSIQGPIHFCCNLSDSSCLVRNVSGVAQGEGVVFDVAHFFAYWKADPFSLGMTCEIRDPGIAVPNTRHLVLALPIARSWPLNTAVPVRFSHVIDSLTAEISMLSTCQTKTSEFIASSSRTSIVCIDRPVGNRQNLLWWPFGVRSEVSRRRLR